ncbi:STAS domain-containing protein [Polyangium aurulentum]|uniref:STAS domain-containing protein n=1 Tax=Polyangium aurulentum TaxID=2567896 RepID=UPI0010AE5A38|nr:STAS domain-containing protein [Polyangium aurulentum]UQA58497.1 HAMP domain-containing protein [Polyangium aurulentum]
MAAEDPRPPSSRPRRTLARRVLLKMAVRLSIVTGLVTGLSYAHMIRSVTQAREQDLAHYIRARGERENELFRLAEDHHGVLRAALLDRLHAMGDEEDLAGEFDRRFAISPDGALRSRPERTDPAKQAQAALDESFPRTPAHMKTVIAAQDTLSAFGRSMIIRFANTWMTTPENAIITYWPAAPRWAQTRRMASKPADHEFFLAAAPAQNPAGKTIWTKSYIEPQGETAMVSGITPIHDGDRFLGVIGHDLPLSDLLQRTQQDHLEGGYNVLLNRSGDLIAHPALTAAIEKAGGSFAVGKADDPTLAAIFRRATAVTEIAAVVESEDGHDYLAVTRLAGPDWLLVAVHPKAELQKPAYASARVVLVAGMAALLLELGLVYLILRKEVKGPLGEILAATRKVAAGNLDVALDAGREDELGALAASFNGMAGAVRERSEAQEKALAERKEAEERIRSLNEELAGSLELERERLRTLERLNRAVEELSTPVLEVWKDVLALPVIGNVDEARAATMTARLLEEVVRTQCRFVLLDITGVDMVDTFTADRLLKVVAAVELLGAQCVLTGVRPNVAQALVGLGIGFGKLRTRRTLKQGLLECIRRAEGA